MFTLSERPSFNSAKEVFILNTKALVEQEEASITGCVKHHGIKAKAQDVKLSKRGRIREAQVRFC